MYCGIYKIENLITGHVYIGQSVNITSRWAAHKRADDDFPIHRAIKKYGIENFDFSIIEECPKEQLNDREIYWINYYDSFKNGYNATPGGQDGVSFQALSFDKLEEIRKLLQEGTKTNIEIGKLYNVSDQTISDINTGRVWFDDKISYPIRPKRPNKKYFCVDCGKEITNKATRCIECNRKYRQIVERPSKEELNNILINLQGNFTACGRLFNVSSSSIRKWCKFYGLPYHSKDYKPIVQTKPKVDTSQKVQQINKQTGEIVQEFPSIKAAQRITGIRHIYEASDPLDDAHKSAGGYFWKRI